jgi:GMP synthase (glutamine-hydrolysing)
LKKAGDRGLPVLGVCFGHQLLGFAYGSKVILNPEGREIGSIQVELTAEGRTDPLFANLPQVFWIQTTHEDIVSSLPNGARHLALNPQTPIQSFGMRRNIRGVQFHPEMEPEMISALVRARAQILEREGKSTRELLSGIRRTRAGRRILLNFLRNFD